MSHEDIEHRHFQKGVKPTQKGQPQKLSNRSLMEMTSSSNNEERSNRQPTQNRDESFTKADKRNCYFCIKFGQFGRNRRYKLTCNNCGIQGHLKNVCRGAASWGSLNQAKQNFIDFLEPESDSEIEDSFELRS